MTENEPNPLLTTLAALKIAIENLETLSLGGPLGRAADAASLSAALSTEDITILTAIQDRLGALTTPAGGSANKLLTDLLAKFPDQSGSKVPVVETALAALIGALADAPASISADETISTLSSLVALLKASKNLDIDISGFLSALKFGDQAKAASLSVTPGTDIPTTRDIGRVTQAGFGYKGADRKTMAGAAQESTIASGAKCVVVAAEGGDIRFAINGDATSISAGYIIAGGQAIALLVAATKLSVYGPIGAYANIMYYG